TTLQKMLNNLWMVLCLLLGSILAVALISSIPVYTEGVLQRLLTRDLEDFQVKSSVFPGRSELSRTFVMPDEPDKKLPLFRFLDTEIERRLLPALGIPVLTSTRQLTLDYLTIYPEGRAPDPKADAKLTYVKLEGMRGFQDHMALVAGRAAAAGETDGTIEAVISQKAMQDLGLYLDRTYDVWDAFYSTGRVARVRIVGVWTIRDPRDPYWFEGLGEYGESLMIDPALLEQRFIVDNSPNFSLATWHYAFDYHAIRIADVQALMARIQDYQRLASDNRITWDFPMLDILKSYAVRASVLKTTLWFLQAPVLLMLVFFIYMVSQLILESDANEIAVLKSRGASSPQIFARYLIEGTILAVLALAVGPLLGMSICLVLGSSNGFLEFVQRAALPLGFSHGAALYAVLGALLFIAAMLLPALVASRTTIVEHKRKRGRARRGPVWKRFFVDGVLLAVSGYGLYGYYTQQKILKLTGVTGGSLPLDPLLFVISVAFLLGAGMLFLRIYPSLVRGIFWLGRKRWSPVLYTTFVHVGRAMGHEQFLMLFLILSLGLGVYNSVAARTVNRNVEDRVRYAVGADITLQPHWEDLAPMPSDRLTGPGGAVQGSDDTVTHQWVEPPFAPYQQIAGTDLATKVYRNDQVTATFGTGQGVVTLMGIVPNEFGKVAWFRSDLLPVHQNAYLNLLGSSPKAVLVSSNLRGPYNLRLGDPIYLTWAGQGLIDAYIYAFIDYWPTYNPLTRTNGRPASLVVANLAYLQAKMEMEPYQVWLRKSPGAGSAQVFDDIRQKGLQIESLSDSSQRVVAERNDPMLQGTNGALTLGFIIAMGISFVGFLLYWILSLKGRTLQFGILRAMGLRQSRVVLMLILEQLLISGVAIAVGILVGTVASYLFVPLLQLTASAEAQVPPFAIVSLRSDFLKVLALAAAMLGSGAVLFRWMIRRIRIHQAIKLGEE
ncbi:MAG TPA: FtsX-like permease family protein, partial [Spirochaetia bacterium]|nr:FtsX-like permease family protein [Spirochaetia bacterium]